MTPLSRNDKGKIMQITEFKAILARKINNMCEDSKNPFARMESDCTLRFGSYKNHFVH